MHSFGKQSIALLLAIAFLAIPFNALADTEEPQQVEQYQVPDEGQTALDDPQINAANMVGDALIARPLGLVGTIAGFGLFLVASPFALISGSAGDAWDAMVVYPAEFTFTRPLGDFD